MHFTLNSRFPGQVYDQEDNLYYNDHRNYDATLGRYVQSDPIGLRGGSATYSYASNNPLTSADPSGLVTWKGAMVMDQSGLEFHVGGFRFRGLIILQSDCVQGKRGVAKVRVEGYGTGAGIGLAAGGATSSVSASTVEVKDGLADPKIAALSGSFSMVYAGTVIGGWSSVAVGAAVGTGLDWGLSTDLIGAVGMHGTSVASGHIECCPK